MCVSVRALPLLTRLIPFFSGNVHSYARWCCQVGLDGLPHVPYDQLNCLTSCHHIATKQKTKQNMKPT